MTMGFICIKTYNTTNLRYVTDKRLRTINFTTDNIEILSVVKLIVRNLLSVTYSRFVGSLLQFFNKER